MRVAENVPLAELTTLRLGGPARRLVAPEREQDVIDTVRALDARAERLLIVGGGSNLVVGDAGVDGTVLHMATRGIELAPAPDGTVHVTAAAGEPWDDLVARVVAEGLAGMECLAGIPGLVGAVPMQNVGAYGQDVSETIVSVRTWDRAARRVALFDRAACRFAYRSSVFRGHEGHVILGVTFALAKRATSMPLRYAELTRALGVAAGERAPLGATREMVIALRRTKGMVLDPGDPDTASAGSFFTNPIVDAPALAALRERVGGAAESMPVFPEADGRAKVSAAWLIERAGFAKGFAMGRVAISSKHALALTNRGDATTGELLVLARAIRDGVRERFGVVLENEPVFVGAAL
ncbi:MAG TPA: UDP-N-acetylmuramate dehydrogenase [Labilithrix sp.]|nr:UDP-N-acetylmuramate dehydrogenase [Labilithrix sp.]